MYVSRTACSKALRLFSFMKVCSTNRIILLTAGFITLNIHSTLNKSPFLCLDILPRKIRTLKRPGNISHRTTVQHLQALFIYFYASASSTFIGPMTLTKASLNLPLLLIVIVIRHICSSTLSRHVRQYIAPHIQMQWAKQQKGLLEEAQDRGDITVMGDCRSDSPGKIKSLLFVMNGLSMLYHRMITLKIRINNCSFMFIGHCAKYGTYSLMDGRTGKVLDSQLIQVS